MKKFILSFVFILLGCNTYVSTDYVSPRESFRIREKKIALIGFKPFSKKGKENFPPLYDTKVLIESFKYGKHYTEFEVKGIQKTVNSEKIEKFIKDYITLVGPRNAGKELESLFVVNENGSLSLKNRETDYYLVGYHGPIERKSNQFIEKIAFSALWLFTYTLFPYIEQIDAEYKFFLYDKDLNLLDIYQGTSLTITYSNWYILVNDKKQGGIIIKDHKYFVEIYKYYLDTYLGKKKE
jgi:hypothetical protein